MYRSAERRLLRKTENLHLKAHCFQIYYMPHNTHTHTTQHTICVYIYMYTYTSSVDNLVLIFGTNSLMGLKSAVVDWKPYRSQVLSTKYLFIVLALFYIFFYLYIFFLLYFKYLFISFVFYSALSDLHCFSFELCCFAFVWLV